MIGGKHCAWNSKQCSSDHIAVSWWGEGVKWWADRRGSTVHGTVSSAAVIILLLVGGVGVKRRADRRGSTEHGTVSSAAAIILLLVGGVRV